MGCVRHREAPAADCGDCRIEAAIERALRAMPEVTPPTGLRSRVDAAIEQGDNELDARLRSTPLLEAPADLRERVLAEIPDAAQAAAGDGVEQALGAVPMVEPPADLAARINAGIDAAVEAEDTALETELRAMPMVEPTVDVRAGVMATLAWEDRLRRGTMWRTAAAGLSAAAAGAFLLADPAGWSSAWAGMLDKADGWMPVGDAPLAPRLPQISGPVVETLDKAHLLLTEGGLAETAAHAAAPATGYSVTGLVGMIVAVVVLGAANVVAARWWSRRA